MTKTPALTKRASCTCAPCGGGGSTRMRNTKTVAAPSMAAVAIPNAIRRRMAFGMATAAIDGAATVFVFLILVLPPPPHGAHVQLARFVNAGVFVIYLTLAVFAGLKWSVR